MVDLAYAAVFFGDQDLAREVIHLEERMDETINELRIMCMLATRSSDDAEGMAAILAMANAMEEIADAADDIARVVLKDVGVPGELRDDLRHAEEVVARVKLREGNELANLSLRKAAAMWTSSSGRPATSSCRTAMSCCCRDHRRASTWCASWLVERRSGCGRPRSHRACRTSTVPLTCWWS
jgi:hypothetical protein